MWVAIARGNGKPMTSLEHLLEIAQREPIRELGPRGISHGWDSKWWFRQECLLKVMKGEKMFNEFLKELGEEYEGYILEDLDRGLVKIVVKKDGRKADVCIPYDIFMGNPVTDTSEFLRNLAKSLVDELNRG